MQGLLLSLDLSTSSTGYAYYKDGKLIEYGNIYPDMKGLSKLVYPEQQIKKIRTLVDKLCHMIIHGPLGVPDQIVIEEINAHKNRMAGKTLDMFHGVLLHCIGDWAFPRITYMDSDGKDGWRTKLRFVLTDADKEANKEAKKLNKTIKGRKLPIITKKHLAARFVQAKYGIHLDVDENSEDADKADAIGLGHAYLFGGI